MHGVNFLAMSIDTAICSQPYFAVYAVLAFFAYGVVYVVFSVVFWRVGGRDAYGNAFIYSVLNWSSSSTVVRHLPPAALCAAPPCDASCCCVSSLPRRRGLASPPAS